MPSISRFFGIAIYIYYNEHQPPHFHAEYGEYWIEIIIDSLTIIGGYIPPRALGLIMEWASLHQDELKKVWQQAIEHRPLDTIEPLH